MTLKHVAMLAVAFSLTACLDSGDPFGGTQQYGFAFFETRQFETGEFVMRPNAIFYRSGLIQLPGTHGLHDICRVEDIGPGGNPSFPPTIDAGEALELTLSGTETLLLPDGKNPERYAMPEGEWLEFVPGDTATLVVPGVDTAFPSWTLRAKTAEAFTFEPVATHEGGPTDLVLEWSPAAEEPFSRMVVELRYFNEGDKRIYCELNDDGIHTISAEDAEGWRTAEPAGKDAIFTRWRITGEVMNNSVLLVMSTLQVPTDTVLAPATTP